MVPAVESISILPLLVKLEDAAVIVTFFVASISTPPAAALSVIADVPEP